jgi:homoserine kinase type II
MVHGDWHPGNLLFRQEQVVAVVDYDSARMHARVIDLANGALQFSILGGGEDPASWPSQVRLPQFGQFLCGYDAINVITQAELKALPYLMCEAMIVEAILPIAATGTFSGIQGLSFLQMIQRKVRWVLDHTEQLASAISA